MPVAFTDVADLHPSTCGKLLIKLFDLTSLVGAVSVLKLIKSSIIRTTDQSVKAMPIRACVRTHLYINN